MDDLERQAERRAVIDIVAIVGSMMAYLILFTSC